MEFVDQRLGLQENFLGLRSRIAAAGDHRLAEQHDQFERLARASLMIGKRLEQFERALQVADGFDVGRALDRALTGFLKVFDRTLGQPSLGQVMGHQLRMRFDNLRKVLV